MQHDLGLLLNVVVPANGSGYCRPDDRLRRGPITPVLMEASGGAISPITRVGGYGSPPSRGRRGERGALPRWRRQGGSFGPQPFARGVLGLGAILGTGLRQ